MHTWAALLCTAVINFFLCVCVYVFVLQWLPAGGGSRLVSQNTYKHCTVVFKGWQGTTPYTTALCILCMCFLQHSIDFVLIKLYWKHSIHTLVLVREGRAKCFTTSLSEIKRQELNNNGNHIYHDSCLTLMSQHVLLRHGDVNKTAWPSHTRECTFCFFGLN